MGAATKESRYHHIIGGRRRSAAVVDFNNKPNQRRHHVTDTIATAPNPYLPSTTTEPRFPKTSTELEECMKPLSNLWGMHNKELSDMLLFQQQQQQHQQQDRQTTDHNNSRNDVVGIPSLTKEQLLQVLSLPLVPGDDVEIQQIVRSLYTGANFMTNIYHGNKVHYRGLLEFSNICRSDCYYCGIRKSMNKPQQQHISCIEDGEGDGEKVTTASKLQRYLLDYDTIMDTVRWCAKRGYGSIMLQSGEVVSSKRINYLTKIINDIKQVVAPEMGISLSVGELSHDQYQTLYDAGATRYLLRIETTNPELFAKLHPQPQQTFHQRLQCLRTLNNVGYMVGTGVMIGLPTQTIEDLVNDILFFRDESYIDMIGMGPYILQRNTPTGTWWCHEHPDVFEAIQDKEIGIASSTQIDRIHQYDASLYEITTRMIALTRLLLGDVNIAATTALQTIHPMCGREVALMRGANILMPILTPKLQRSNYQLYEGKVCIDETKSQCKSCLELRVMAAGKSIAYNERGDPPHYTRRKTKTKTRCDGRQNNNKGEIQTKFKATMA